MVLKQYVTQQQNAQSLPEIQEWCIKHFWKQPIPQELNYKSLCYEHKYCNREQNKNILHIR
jgi:hypothetical protein